MSVHDELGQIVRDARHAKGMTIAVVAKKLGYNNQQFIHLFETGKSKIPQEVLGKLVVILGLNKKKVIKMLVDSYSTELVNNMAKGEAAEGLQ